MTAIKTHRKPAKLGWRGYAAILAAIKRKPRTSQQLCDLLRVHILTMRRILARMRELGAVHISGWHKAPGKNGSAVPVWGFWAGVDAPRIDGRPGTMRGHLTRITALPELAQVVEMLKHMEREPISKQGLCDAVGSQWANVGKFVNECHRLRLVHIADWSVRLRGGSRGALYGFGGQADAPRPPREDRATIERRSRQARADRARQLRLIHATAAGGGEWRAVA